jgi:hypothetical protein
MKKTSITLQYVVGKKTHSMIWTVVGDFTAAHNAAIVEAKRRHKSARKIVWTSTSSIDIPAEHIAPTMAEPEDSSKSHWVYIPTEAEMNARYDLTASLDFGFAKREREFYEKRTARELKGDITAAWYANDGGTFQRARYYLLKLTGERYGNGAL